MADVRKFLYCLFMTALTLIVGAYFNYTGVSTWYQEMEKPALTPPDYVFPIAWILIYLLMTVCFLSGIRQRPHPAGKLAHQRLFHQSAVSACFVDFCLFLHRSHRAGSAHRNRA